MRDLSRREKNHSPRISYSLNKQTNNNNNQTKEKAHNLGEKCRPQEATGSLFKEHILCSIKFHGVFHGALRNYLTSSLLYSRL